jgi:methylated-DNA-[protein]-cysteine S-methyltransferase
MLWCLIDSPAGQLTLVSDGTALVALLFDTAQAEVEAQFPDAAQGEDRVLEAAKVQLAQYFAGTRRDFDLPLAPHGGTAFQRAVWRALATIPYGTTVSYGTIASTIGKPTASRAVGAANGANPLSILVPCHRVIGAGGQMTGYGGGLWRKELLLGLEQRAAS